MSCLFLLYKNPELKNFNIYVRGVQNLQITNFIKIYKR